MNEATLEYDRLKQTLWWCGVVLGSAVALLGLVVIVGWFVGSRTLVQVHPAFVPMQFNTALGFVLCGTALLLRSANRVGQASLLAGLVCALGILTLTQYLTDTSLGIDELLMKHYITTGTSNPGRMAPNTAVCFTLTGLLALVPLLHWPRSIRSVLRVVLASLTLGLAVVALAGYFTGLETAYGWGSLTRMAVHTSLGFVAISIAVLCLSWRADISRDRWLPRWLPVVSAVAVTTASCCLWQAMGHAGAGIHEKYPELENFSNLSTLVLIAGISLAFALALASYLAQQAGHRAREVSRTNLALQDEIATREAAERALQTHRDNLEVTVIERTAELEAARYEAETANRAKSEFLSHMSHELRTPLNGILGYAQILQRDPAIQDKQRTSLEAIMNCGDHLLALINDVLDLSKIEAGRVEVDLAPLDLHRLIHSVGDVVRTRAERKGVQLHVELAENLPLAIVSDAAKVRQILVNLAGNAVKFTNQGKVSLRAEKNEGGELLLAVEDTGVGIAADELDEIFDPFKQVEAGKAAGGTGLGLAITQRLVEALGGSLSVASRLGQGSAFTVTLPLTEADASTIELQSDDGSLSGDRLVLADGQRCTILIVDDRETNRGVLQGMLTAAGFDTLTASDGDEAMDALRQNTEVALVLMDLRMPRVSGQEALRQIRDDPDLKRLKVIAVTASVYPGFRQEAMNAGFDDFLGKPFRVTELMERLRKHLGLKFRSLPASDSKAKGDPDASDADVAMTIPVESLGQLREALAIKNLTAIKSVAEELADGDGAALAGERILQYVRAFDFNGLNRFIEELERRNG